MKEQILIYLSKYVLIDSTIERNYSFLIGFDCIQSKKKLIWNRVFNSRVVSNVK